jgi:hypothetical protein
MVFKIILLLFCLLYCWSSNGTALAARTEILKATVEQNEEIDKLETLGIKSTVHVGTGPGAKATIFAESVRPGSKAFYEGVAAGDKICGLVQKGDTFLLNIERSGTPYQIVFKGVPLKPAVDPLKTIPEVSIPTHQRDIPILPITKKTSSEHAEDYEDKSVQVLKKYEIEILIDISGSMSQADGTDGDSKFEWCHLQLKDLVKKLEPYKRTMTITTFNDGFITDENCLPLKVEHIFGTTGLGGGTDLVDPLSAGLERANKIIHSRTTPGRKVLIAVITDGMPNIPSDPKVVNRAIIDFTQCLDNRDQVVLTFLQVGEDGQGQAFCKSLEGLDAQGAKFDIVHSIPFPQLKARGLTNALAESIIDELAARAVRARAGKDKSGLSADAAVQEQKSERARIEKQLTGN